MKRQVVVALLLSWASWTQGVKIELKPGASGCVGGKTAVTSDGKTVWVFDGTLFSEVSCVGLAFASLINSGSFGVVAEFLVNEWVTPNGKDRFYLFDDGDGWSATVSPDKSKQKYSSGAEIGCNTKQLERQTWYTQVVRCEQQLCELILDGIRQCSSSGVNTQIGSLSTLLRIGSSEGVISNGVLRRLVFSDLQELEDIGTSPPATSAPTFSIIKTTAPSLPPASSLSPTSVPTVSGNVTRSPAGETMSPTVQDGDATEQPTKQTPQNSSSFQTGLVSGIGAGVLAVFGAGLLVLRSRMQRHRLQDNNLPVVNKLVDLQQSEHDSDGSTSVVTTRSSKSLFFRFSFRPVSIQSKTLIDV